ncbi:MAG TPA: MFS transporter [Thermoanaerobaculia bacterium]|nr:MFS transporter [Thermoanaerobaculia bacterium]
MKTRTLLLVGATLYFAEGFPYGLISEVLPLYMRQGGASLRQIGFLSAIAILWSLKFAWAPAVDRFATPAIWMRGALLALALVLGGFALSLPSPGPLFWFFVVAIIAASATQDLAIDAFTIVATPPPLLGRVNAIRITFYRVAIIVGGGLIPVAAASLGWRRAFFLALGTALILLTLTFTIPRTQKAERAALHWRDVAGELSQPGMALTLSIALLYRLGDSALTPMTKPFWLDSGYRISEVATLTTTVGISLTIVGAIIGAAVIDRIGVARSLLVLGLFQMLSNGGYALASLLGAGRPVMWGAAAVENLCGGLGTAAFLAYLMLSSSRRAAATTFAAFTALNALSRSVAGAGSGFAVERVGYTTYFVLTMLLAVPGLLLASRVVDVGENSDPG